MNTWLKTVSKFIEKNPEFSDMKDYIGWICTEHNVAFIHPYTYEQHLIEEHGYTPEPLHQYGKRKKRSKKLREEDKKRSEEVWNKLKEAVTREDTL